MSATMRASGTDVSLCFARTGEIIIFLGLHGGNNVFEKIKSKLLNLLLSDAPLRRQHGFHSSSNHQR